MAGHWIAWGEFVETTRGPKVVARSAHSCARGNCRENMYPYCADKSSPCDSEEQPRLKGQGHLTLETGDFL